MRAWTRRSLMLAAIIALTALSISAGAEQSAATKAADFTLRDIHGDTIVFSRILRTHRMTLLNFWATWCPPCRREIPELVSFYEEYRGKGVEIVAVDLQEDRASVKAFAEAQKMRFSVLIDTDGTIGAKYGIYAIPTTYILDGQGRIKKKIEGATTAEKLRKTVNQLLKGG